MIEDKLTTDQRIRLEALGQSTTSFVGSNTSGMLIVARAQDFEDYIREGKVATNG